MPALQLRKVHKELHFPLLANTFEIEHKTISFFVSRLANKLQPGAVKMNDTSKVSNAAMRANKEVRTRRPIKHKLNLKVTIIRKI